MGLVNIRGSCAFSLRCCADRLECELRAAVDAGVLAWMGISSVSMMAIRGGDVGEGRGPWLVVIVGLEGGCAGAAALIPDARADAGCQGSRKEEKETVLDDQKAAR